jgi:ubiquitin-protein ligase
VTPGLVGVPATTMAPTALAIRRITIDAKKAMDLADQGLFWIPDESEITHGWAVVCACDGTPYHGGAFCFEVRFPDNYPFEPPVFTYLTNDGRTRFNPNLYKNGKVCLSLLNTWQGEPWSGIQSLSSVLQCIQTAVLNDEPLRNEPGYATGNFKADMEMYNRMTFHATLETAIIGQLAEQPPYLVPVYDGVRAWALRAKGALIKKAEEHAATWDGHTEHFAFFQMTQKYRFGALAARLRELT